MLFDPHLIDEIRDGDRGIVLHDGRVLAFGSIGEVTLSAEATPITEAFTNLTGKGKT